MVLGTSPEDRELFVRHTYLATVNKLIAILTLDPELALTTDDDLTAILDGTRFSQQGIHNFIEEDFFTWFYVESIRTQGLSLLKRLLGTLRAFDFRNVNQDVLKELYQEIVGREARHATGEYYTPD